MPTPNLLRSILAQVHPSNRSISMVSRRSFFRSSIPAPAPTPASTGGARKDSFDHLIWVTFAAAIPVGYNFCAWVWKDDIEQMRVKQATFLKKSTK